jgi:FkbM family methyltransferase
MKAFLAAKGLTRKILLYAAARIQRLAAVAGMSPHDIEVDRFFRANGDKTLRQTYDLGPESLVMDCGGFEGQWASDMFARYGCTIYVFEPVPQFAENLRQRFRRNGRIVIHEVALAAVDGATTLVVCGDASSVFAHGSVRTKARMISAAHWLQANGIGCVDLMKVNIEGGEFDLLDHLIETKAIRLVKELQVQFHDCLPDAPERRDRIRMRLEETHECTWNYPWVWENWRRRG